MQVVDPLGQHLVAGFGKRQHVERHEAGTGRAHEALDESDGVGDARGVGHADVEIAGLLGEPGADRVGKSAGLLERLEEVEYHLGRRRHVSSPSVSTRMPGEAHRLEQPSAAHFLVRIVIVAIAGQPRERRARRHEEAVGEGPDAGGGGVRCELDFVLVALVDGDQAGVFEVAGLPAVTPAHDDVHLRHVVDAGRRIGAAAHAVEHAILGEDRADQRPVDRIDPAPIFGLELADRLDRGEAFGFGHRWLSRNRERLAACLQNRNAYAAASPMPSSPSLRYSVERPIPSRRATSVMRPR